MLKWPKHQFNTGTITAVDVPTMSDDVGSVFSERVLVSFPGGSGNETKRVQRAGRVTWSTVCYSI